MAGLFTLFTMPVITLILLSISATSVMVISLIPVYMRLLRHIPAVLRMCQGVTSGLSLTMIILAVWLDLGKISCRAVLSLEILFLTSSLTWFILDNADVVLMTLNKPLTSWRSFGVVMAVGWGIGLLPLGTVLICASADLGLKDGTCWFGEDSHWALAGLLFLGAVTEVVSLTLAMFALLKRRREEPDLRMLFEKKSRLLTSALTYALWTMVNCIGCLAVSSGNHIIFYTHGAFTLIYALLHGGLFVLGEYKVNSRLSVVYRLLRLEPVSSDGMADQPNPRPGTSQSAARTNQASPREVCRVPPLSKEGPRSGAVYRRKESEKQFDLKL